LQKVRQMNICSLNVNELKRMKISGVWESNR